MKLLFLFKKMWEWRGLDSDDPASIFVGWDIYGEEGRHKNARIQGKWISYKDGIFMSHSIISCQTFRVRLRTSTLHRNVLFYTNVPETDFFQTGQYSDPKYFPLLASCCDAKPWKVVVFGNPSAWPVAHCSAGGTNEKWELQTVCIFFSPFEGTRRQNKKQIFCTTEGFQTLQNNKEKPWVYRCVFIIQI